MSDREFDNYLTLLASLLRLDGRQRKQIAEELRAHLEDRLADLVAQGSPHEEAVQRALAEFGDAAGLAASFAKVSRGRKRRWLMRVTTFSIAATLLIAAGIFTFWPGRNAAPGAAAVVAQAVDPFGAPTDKSTNPRQPVAGADPFADPTDRAAGKADPARNTEQAKPVVPSAKPTAAAVLEAKLNQVTMIDMVEMQLRDMVLMLQDQHEFPILLKTKKLDEAGISPDTPITKKLAGIRLSTALQHILEELDLTYVVEDELVLITTPEDAQSRLEIRVYDCRDLLAVPRAGKDKAAAAPGGEGAAGGYGEAAPVAGASGYGGVPGMPGGMMPGMGMGGGYGGMVSEHDQRSQRLMSILMTNVDDQSWQMAANPPMDENQQPKRGRGMISEYDGLIVVTQTAQTHRKIERVLEMLRRASGLEASKTNKVVR